MLRFGHPEYLECSSKGGEIGKQFSAFYARIKWRNNRSIEDLYQARKLFNIDGELIQGLPIKEAKGKKPINIEDCRAFYSQLWTEYFQENPHLLDVIKQYNGFSDIFGQSGHACQAEEVYRIRREYSI
jgi:hypothetical protein